MKRRLPALLPALTLALSLSPVSLGAEGTAFVDVHPEDWFAPYVEICVEKGLMKGVGEGRFAPERALSAEECSVLALRLYDMIRGGDGVFERAPEEFGILTVAIENGPTLRGAIREDSPVEGWPLVGEKTWALGYAQKITGPCMLISITAEEQRTLLETDPDFGPRATASYGGVEYPGELRYSLMGAYLLFSPSDGNAFFDGLWENQWFAAPAGAWYRDAFYFAYTVRQSLEEDDGRALILVQGSGQADRWNFAQKLSHAVEELPAVNKISWIPAESWQEPILLPLYNAGILTGVDAYGSFYPEGTLTRAEAAAMLARVLEPELRVAFSPAPIPEDGLLVPEERYGTAYRLTPTELTHEEVDALFSEPVLPTEGEYDFVSYTGDGRFLACRQEGALTRWFCLDGEGGLLRELPSVETGSKNDWWGYGEGLPCPWWDEETGLYGYVDVQLRWVIEPQWSNAGPFSLGRAEVQRDVWSQETNQMTWEGNLIDREGRALLEWGRYSGFSRPYDDPEYTGPTRYKFYDQLHLPSRLGWVDPETGEEFFFPVGEEPVISNDHFKNGYLKGYKRYYSLDLTPVTQEFEFVWDVDPEGGGYVQWGEKIWHIQFEP